MRKNGKGASDFVVDQGADSNKRTSKGDKEECMNTKDYSDVVKAKLSGSIECIAANSEDTISSPPNHTKIYVGEIGKVRNMMKICCVNSLLTWANALFKIRKWYSLGANGMEAIHGNELIALWNY